MIIKRSFADSAISLEALVDLVLAKELDEIIDHELFYLYEEGKFGGIDDEEK